MTAAVSTGTWLRSVFRCGSSGRNIASMIPDRAKAALTTRALAMITVMSLEKPSKAFLAGTTPSSTPASSETSAIRSYRKRPQTKAPMVTPIRPKASAC